MGAIHGVPESRRAKRDGARLAQRHIDVQGASWGGTGLVAFNTRGVGVGTFWTFWQAVFGRLLAETLFIESVADHAVLVFGHDNVLFGGAEIAHEHGDFLHAGAGIPVLEETPIFEGGVERHAVGVGYGDGNFGGQGLNVEVWDRRGEPRLEGFQLLGVVSIEGINFGVVCYPILDENFEFVCIENGPILEQFFTWMRLENARGVVFHFGAQFRQECFAGVAVERGVQANTFDVQHPEGFDNTTAHAEHEWGDLEVLVFGALLVGRSLAESTEIGNFFGEGLQCVENTGGGCLDGLTFAVAVPGLGVTYENPIVFEAVGQSTVVVVLEL